MNLIAIKSISLKVIKTRQNNTSCFEITLESRSTVMLFMHNHNLQHLPIAKKKQEKIQCLNSFHRIY